jgi:hypothetical protein
MQEPPPKIAPLRFGPSGPQPPKPLPPVPTDEPKSRRLSLFQLTNETCKWPHGNFPPFTFCGHPVELFSRYCPHHRKRGSTKPAVLKLPQFIAR